MNNDSIFNAQLEPSFPVHGYRGQWFKLNGHYYSNLFSNQWSGWKSGVTGYPLKIFKGQGKWIVTYNWLSDKQLREWFDSNNRVEFDIVWAINLGNGKFETLKAAKQAVELYFLSAMELIKEQKRQNEEINEMTYDQDEWEEISFCDLYPFIPSYFIRYGYYLGRIPEDENYRLMTVSQDIKTKNLKVFARVRKPSDSEMNEFNEFINPTRQPINSLNLL